MPSVLQRLKFFRRTIPHAVAITRDWYRDIKLGIRTIGFNPPLEQDPSFYKDMCGYEASFYSWLINTAEYLHLDGKDVFVDIGCGKGRTLIFMAGKDFKKIIGVELDGRLLDIARENIDRIKEPAIPIELINADAAELIIKEGTVFFIFNPFGRKTLERVVVNIKSSLVNNPREIKIIYYSPQYREVLDRQGWLVLEGKIKNDDCLVWSNTRCVT